MQLWSHCYTVVSYQALFRLSVCKIPAVYLSGAKNVCFCTIGDFGSPTYRRLNHPVLVSLNKFEYEMQLTVFLLICGKKIFHTHLDKEDLCLILTFSHPSDTLSL